VRLITTRELYKLPEAIHGRFVKYFEMILKVRRVPAATRAKHIQECQNNVSNQRDSQRKNEEAPRGWQVSF
jgi:hypothetical protein